jgi:response regulator RpfG family c-di-GMP phosphodiesterase
MLDKILFVDDDQNLLDSLKRQLRNNFNVETALGPREGLVAISQRGPFAVVVCDLRMPLMDGIHFLANAGKIAPDSVRMMLTGNADLSSAIKALNEGNIYRFITKPCEPDTLSALIDQGVRQYRLITAERELLEKTLKGSIRVLTDLISMLNPEAYGRSSRIRHYARETALAMGAAEPWKIETAAMLSQIGYVALPEALLKKRNEGVKLTEAEIHLFESHPGVASELLSHIPRMEAVAEAVYYQLKHFDGSGFPVDPKKEKEIPIGGRVLKAVSDYDFLESRSIEPSQALGILRNREGHYDLDILAALEKVLGVRAECRAKEVFIKELKAGMVFAVDVKAANGRLIASRGQEVSQLIINSLENIMENMEIPEPLRVLEPRRSLQP